MNEMELVTIITLAILTLLVTEVSSLQCYQCSVSLPDDKEKRLCNQFDHSAKYIVDCPYSTMCKKQEIELTLPNGVRISSVIRDCANQRIKHYDYKNRSWFERTDIVEPYEEGCQIIDDKGARTAIPRYCYCKNDLCNSAPKSNHEGYTDIMGVIMVFNLMKYIRSL